MKTILFGLIVLSLSVWAGSPGIDIDVPADEISAGNAELLVQGQPGCGQKGFVHLVRCATNDYGEVKRHSCYMAGWIHLNRRTSVPSGNYYVFYNNSRYPDLVRLDAGDSESLKLTRLNLGSIPYGYQAFVFRDLTVEKEKIQLAEEAWSSSAYLGFADILCSMESSETENLCQSWYDGDAYDLIDSQLLFPGDARVQSAFLFRSQVRYTLPDYLYINSGGNIPFVSVFPGTYGVIYTRGQQVYSKHLGIEVE